MMKETKKGNARDPVLQNTMQLADTIRKTQQKNRRKYEQIRKDNLDYQLKLYKPFIPSQFNRDQIKLAQQILLRQMDKLMEQEAILDMQLDRMAIKELEYCRKRDKEAMNNMDHFTFLRRQWTQNQHISNSQQHIEKLIHNVGSIKGHIHTIIKKQSKYQSTPEIHHLILQSPQYLSLQKRLIELQAKNQIDTSVISTESTSKVSILQEQIQNMKKQLEKVKRENEQLRKATNIQQNQKRAWIYKYKVRANNGGYVVTIHTQTRVSGMPETTFMGVQELRDHLNSQEQKNGKKSQIGSNEIGKRFGMQDIRSPPKFISSKRMELGDRFRPMSP